MPKRVRDYREEYRTYGGTPEQKKNRAERNRARALMEIKVGAAALKGKEVDHKRALTPKHGAPPRPSSPGNTSNLRILSRKANRKKYNG